MAFDGDRGIAFQPSKPVEPMSFSATTLVAAIEAEFGAPRLTVELIPKSSWHLNLWRLLASRDWKRLREMTCAAAGYRCEVCGGVGAQRSVACHEVWRYSDGPSVQRLVALSALCPACHDVKHLGRAESQGRMLDAQLHIAEQNGWSMQRVERYIELQYTLWDVRNCREWDLDLTWLAKFKVSPKPKLPRKARRRAR